MNWRIWYIDNFIVDGSTPEEWEAAPEEGVLAIAAYYGTDLYGRKLGGVWTGSDWYWMFDGQIYQNGESTWETNYWVPNPAPSHSVCKKGKWTTDAEMADVNAQVLNWIN
jgi:hypothetical protein